MYAFCVIVLIIFVSEPATNGYFYFHDQDKPLFLVVEKSCVLIQYSLWPHPLYFECNFGVNSHSSSPFHWIASFPGCGRKWHGKFGKFKLIWKFTMTIIWLLIWVKGYSPVQSTEQTWHLFQDLYEYLYVFYGVQLIRMTKKTWRATRSIHQKGITLGTIHLRVFPWPTRLLVALRSITKVLNQKVAKRPKSVSYFFHHTG